MTYSPSAYVQISQLTVRPGETLTVWLKVSDEIQYQVELRVRQPNPKQCGIAEIFTKGDQEDYLRPNLTFYEDWEPMP